MAEQKKKSIARIQTKYTKNGPLGKLSIELNEIGPIHIKDGRTFVEIPKDCEFYRTHQKNQGDPVRHFLNFDVKQYQYIEPDTWTPDSSESQSGNEEGEDLPF